MKEQVVQTAGSNQEEEDYIDLREVFFVLLNGWKTILLLFLAGAVLAGAYHTFLVTPTYQADAKLYITNTDSVISFSDLQLSSALTEDYSDIIKSRTVLKKVIDEMGLDMSFEDLSKLITIENPDSTHILRLVVTCDDAELSRDIANALLNVSIDQIYQIVGTGEPTIIDKAEAEAVMDVTPSLIKYLVLGALLGTVIACALLVVRMLLDTTMKSENDVEKYLRIPVLASVPYFVEKGYEEE